MGPMTPHWSPSPWVPSSQPTATVSADELVEGGALRYEIVIIRDNAETVWNAVTDGRPGGRWTSSESKAKERAARARAVNPGCRVFIRAVRK
jgi:hypothetical protein